MYPAILSAAQKQRGLEVSLVAKMNTPLAGHLAAAGLDYDTLRIGPYIDPAAAWRLAGLLKKRRPQIIHVHLSRDLALVSLACSMARQRPQIILHKHITSSISKRDILHRYLYGKLSAVVAVSDFVRQNILATSPIDNERIRIIFNGLDPEKNISLTAGDQNRRKVIREELGAPDNDLVLAGVVGRLEPRKGQEILLRAAAKLADRLPELRFAVVGAPESGYDRALKKMAMELGLNDRVVFTGHRKDAASLYAALDILIVPSLEESFGLVAAEGMLAGLPVAASDSGALPEFISDGETGLLFAPGDPQDLARSLERLARDSRLRLKLGQAAREWVVANLSMGKILDQLDNLYEECLKKS